MKVWAHFSFSITQRCAQTLRNATLGLVRFEGFQLDFRSGELLKDGAETVLLPEQSFQILTMLLEHPGKVVSRRQIQQRLWPEGTIASVLR